MCLQYSFGKLSFSCIRFELLFLDHSKDNSSDVFSLSLRLRIDSSYMQFSRYILIQETFLKSAGLSDLSSSFDSVGFSHPVGLSGLEPPTSRLSGVRSNRLSYKPSVVSDARKFLSGWRRRDSNSRPPACKAGALPTELHPHSIWQPPTLPHRLQCSTLGRAGLNRRVRDGNGCFPCPHRHQKSFGIQFFMISHAS